MVLLNLESCLENSSAQTNSRSPSPLALLRGSFLSRLSGISGLDLKYNRVVMDGLPGLQDRPL